MEKESYLAAIFILAHAWVQASEWYLPLLLLYLVVLFIISRDPIKSLWIAFLSVLPFQYGWYQETQFASPTFPDALPIPILIGIFYADALLFLLYVLIVWKKILLKQGVPERLFFPIVVVGIISSGFARFPHVALFGLFTLGKYFLSFLVARSLLVKRGFMKISLEVIFLFVLFNSMLILAQKFHGGPLGISAENFSTLYPHGKFADELPTVYRPGGIYDEPNILASLFSIMMPILLFLSIKKDFLHHAFVSIVMFFSWIGIILTASRTAFVSSVVFLTIFLFFHRKRIEKHLVFLFLSITLSLSPLFFTRLQTLSNALIPSGGGTFRLKQLAIAYDLVRLHPFGVGLNMTQYEMAIRYTPAYYLYNPSEIHNLAAQITVSMGITGLLLFLGFFFFLLREKITLMHTAKNRMLVFGIAGAITQYIVVSSFFPWFLNTTVSGFFWVLAAYTYHDA